MKEMAHSLEAESRAFISPQSQSVVAHRSAFHTRFNENFINGLIRVISPLL